MPLDFNFNVTIGGGGGGGGSGAWGYQAGTDYGTTGDRFVDAVNGNDANAGTSLGAAKKTIQAAVNSISAGVGGKIKVKVGTYNETVTLISGAVGNRLVIEPYGTDAPIITAAEPMTAGWVSCTSGDAAIAGSNWASMIKKTGVAVSTFPQGDPMNANLFAGDVRLNLARKYATGQNVSTWCRALDLLTADSVTLSSTNITAYQKASVTSAFTATQLQKALLVAQGSPNLLHFRKVTISGSNIVPASSIPQDANTDIGWQTNFGFLNLIAAMEAGGWAYDWDGSSSTCDLYAWLPAGKTTADITYSARTNCIVTTGSNQTVQGMILERMSGSMEKMDVPGSIFGYRDFGCAIAGGTTGSTRQNITIQNNLIRRGWQNNQGPTQYTHNGGVTIYGADTIVVNRNSFDDLQGSEGVTVSGTKIEVGWNKFDKVFREDFWPHTSTKVVYHHNLHEGSMGCHTHNNGAAFYFVNEGLEWGNIWKNADFFATWQDANNIAICYNVFEWTGSYYSIKDQSGSTQSYAATHGGMLFNNTIIFPTNRYMSASNSILVDEGAAHAFFIANNIYYGATVGGTTITGNGYNINTRNSFDFPAATGNAFEALDTTFNNRAARDFSIKAGSTVRSAAGLSIAAKVSALAAAYPFFTDFTDAWGDPITQASPGVGAMTDFNQNPMLAA